jgi:hypothetical protein
MTEANNSDMDSGLAASVRRGRPPKARAETSGPDRKDTGRAERVPLGSFRQKLQANNREGFVRRWINDDRQRLQLAQQAGYDFVLHDEVAKSTDDGGKISQIVGSKDGGGALRAYLMEIREDWYWDDQAEKQKRIDATEGLIRRGELTQKVGQDGSYIPSQGITIKRA